MTSKFLRALWHGDTPDGRGGGILFRQCAHCVRRAIPVLFGFMPSYGVGMSRYPFCSEDCKTIATALRNLGRGHTVKELGGERVVHHRGKVWWYEHT